MFILEKMFFQVYQQFGYRTNFKKKHRLIFDVVMNARKLGGLLFMDHPGIYVRRLEFDG